MLEPVEQISHRLAGCDLAVRERRVDRRDRCLGRPLGDRDAAWIAAPVPHALVPEPEPEALGRLQDRGASGQDELGAHLDDGPVAELARVDPAADPIAGLEDDRLDPGRRQRIGRGEPGQPGADDRYARNG